MRNIFIVLITSITFGGSAQSKNAINPDNFHPEIRFEFIFNQPKYAPGDTAYFKGYIINGISNKQKAIEKQVVNIKLLSTTGKVKLYNRVLFVNGSCSNQFVIPNSFEPGIYAMVAYVDDVQTDKNRYIFQSNFIVAGEKEFVNELNYTNIAAMDTLNLHIDVTLDKTQYRTRDNVSAIIMLKDSNDNSVKANMTVSVLQNYLFKNDEIRQCTLCNLPATQLSGNKDDGDYKSSISKERAYYFKAQVVLSDNKKVPDSTLVTFYLNNEDFIYGMYTKNNGRFEFPLFKNFGNDEVFYIITNKTNTLKNAHVVLDDFVPEAAKSLSTKNEADIYGEYASKRTAIQYSYYYYANKEKRRETNWTDDINSDYSVDMQKFELLPSMKEVLGNFVQAVKYKNIKGEEGVRVFMKEKGYYATEDPVYIIDGIMTDNTEYFLNLDPSIISKIRVLRSGVTLHRYGAIGKNGIIVIDTEILNHAENMPRTARSLFITGINQALSFNSKTNWNDLIPDIRPCLYWNPEVTLDGRDNGHVAFTTSDATGTFTLIVQGLTDTGIPVFYSKNFEVTFEK